MLDPEWDEVLVLGGDERAASDEPEPACLAELLED